MKTNPGARMEQANRTAWRIIKEWIPAQMALIETEMVTVEEVFLPYMLTGKQTLYQALSNGDLKMLPGADLGHAHQLRRRRLSSARMPAGVLLDVEGLGFLRAER